MNADTFKAVFLMDGPPLLTVTDLTRGIVLARCTRFRTEDLGPRGFRAIRMNITLAARGYVIPEHVRENTNPLLDGWTITMDGYSTDVVRRVDERYRYVLGCGCTSFKHYPPMSDVSVCMDHGARQPVLRFYDRERGTGTQIL